MGKSMFVDFRSRDLKEFKALLKIEPDMIGSIDLVPSGYSLHTDHVAIHATRHSFNISLDGRIVREVEIPKAVKWTAQDVMSRLDVNKLVTLHLNQKVEWSAYDEQTYRAPFRKPNVVELRDSTHDLRDHRFGITKLTGTLMQVLNYLGHIDEKRNLDYSVLKLVEATRDELRAFYMHNLKAKRDKQAWLIKSDSELYRFFYDRYPEDEPKQVDAGGMIFSTSLDTEAAQVYGLYDGIEFSQNHIPCVPNHEHFLKEKLRNPYVVVYAPRGLVLNGERLQLREKAS